MPARLAEMGNQVRAGFGIEARLERWRAQTRLERLLGTTWLQLGRPGAPAEARFFRYLKTRFSDFSKFWINFDIFENI